jgi:hypothetical protein
VKPRQWPDGASYVEAIQNADNLGDLELRAGSYERRKNGLPKPYSGGFTTTFQVVTANGGFAVRCFTRGNDDLERRYRAITDFLRLVQSDAFCDAAYQAQGIRLDGHWWPIIRMKWVSGRQLNEEIAANLGNASRLQALAGTFRELVGSLAVLGVAHGDLQHGNIIVSSGQLRLIDYDGIYLPALAGMPQSEFGHQNYQHPLRAKAPFDGRLDRFSSLVIYTALIAVAADPSLWARFNNDENLLFRAHDFKSDGSSQLFQALLGRAETRPLAEGLIVACRARYDQVPTLEHVLHGGVSSPPDIGTQASQGTTPHAVPPPANKPPPATVRTMPQTASVRPPYPQAAPPNPPPVSSIYSAHQVPPQGSIAVVLMRAVAALACSAGFSYIVAWVVSR